MQRKNDVAYPAGLFRLEVVERQFLLVRARRHDEVARARHRVLHVLRWTQGCNNTIFRGTDFFNSFLSGRTVAGASVRCEHVQFTDVTQTFERTNRVATSLLTSAVRHRAFVDV